MSSAHASRYDLRLLADQLALTPRGGERPDFGFRLGVGVFAEFCLHAAGDRGHLVAGLEAGEIRSVAPSPRAAQLDSRLDGGVVDDVDLPLVIGVALPVAGEIAEI